MLEVRSSLLENGYRLQISRRRAGLFGKVTFEPVTNWEAGIKEISPLAAAAIDDLDQELIPVDGGSRFVSFAAAAALQNSDAEALNLLPPFPFQLDLQSRGTLGTDAFRIDYQATDHGVRVAGVFSEGFFTAGQKYYRISGVMFSILNQIEHINTEASAGRKIEQFAALRLLLPDDQQNSSIQ
jgi:hypothetical protein